MDRNYIDRYLVVDRYIAGDLTERELHDFEDRLTWDRELLEEVDIAAKLREGLRSMAASGQLDQPLSSKPDSRSLGTGWWAMAASFVAGILATSMFFQQAAVTNLDDGVPVQVVALNLMRDFSGQQLEVVDPDGLTVLTIAIDGTQPRYDVELRARDTQEPIWSQTGLSPGNTRTLAVGINNRLLREGQYTLSVYAYEGNSRVVVNEIPFSSVISE